MALASPIETLRPDVFLVEKPGIPRIVGVGVGTFGAVGVAEKGPIDRPVLVTDMNTFYRFFGGRFMGSYLEPCMRQFFREGGRRAYVVRVVGMGAAPSVTSLRDQAVPSLPCLQVFAANPGSWGNRLQITTERVATRIAPTPPVGPPFPSVPVQVGQTEIPVQSIRGFRLGDVLQLGPNADGVIGRAIVRGFVVATRVLLTTPVEGPAGATWSLDLPVRTSSSHRATTESLTPLASGGDGIRVRSAFNFVVGQHVTIIANTPPFTNTTVTLTQVDGDFLKFAPVVIPDTIPAGAVVVSQEFDLKVYEKGLLAEAPFEFLSMSETNQRDYVGIRLAGETNESITIKVVDLFSAVPPPYSIPAPVVLQDFTAGSDGATPTDGDYIGSEVDPKSGIFLFDLVERELNFFAVPGISAASVVVECTAYCDRKKVIDYLIDPPLWANLPQEIYDWRMIHTNVDSSHAVYYYPWIIERDPILNQRVPFPPSGHVAGQWSAVAAEQGVHVAPMNIPLRGVLGLTHNTTDGEHDILNPVGINVIRQAPGEGIRVWGLRTAFSLKDGRHYVPVRRLLNFIMASLKAGNRFLVGKPINTGTFIVARRANEEFLESLWLRGQLFPADDKSRAYFVKCDEENNPMPEIRAGRLHIEVGVNPPFPAEFVILTVGIWDGGVTIEEEILRRG